MRCCVDGVGERYGGAIAKKEVFSVQSNWMAKKGRDAEGRRGGEKKENP